MCGMLSPLLVLHAALILGSNHRAHCYQKDCWGNTLSPSLEVSVEQKENVQGWKKITKCSQPHRKPDGPERCMIKVKWILYLQHSLRPAVIQHHIKMEQSELVKCC